MTDDATLILRGRYATYASERRAVSTAISITDSIRLISCMSGLPHDKVKRHARIHQRGKPEDRVPCRLSASQCRPDQSSGKGAAGLEVPFRGGKQGGGGYVPAASTAKR